MQKYTPEIHSFQQSGCGDPSAPYPSGSGDPILGALAYTLDFMFMWLAGFVRDI